jgi:hypothetical protein
VFGCRECEIILYLAATSSSLQGRHKNLGVMVGPRTGGLRPIAEGRFWAGDNDAFKKFDKRKFLKHLDRMQEHSDKCLFFAAPDVVGDSKLTLERFGGWADIIKQHGYKVAYVAQDGAELQGIPKCDAVFIGGSTEWKISEGSVLVMQRAKIRGLWVHVGRVNSLKRCLWAYHHGADSVDGTHLSFHGTGFGMYELESWVTEIEYERGNKLCFTY